MLQVLRNLITFLRTVTVIIITRNLLIVYKLMWIIWDRYSILQYCKLFEWNLVPFPKIIINQYVYRNYEKFNTLCRPEIGMNMGWIIYLKIIKVRNIIIIMMIIIIINN